MSSAPAELIMQDFVQLLRLGQRSRMHSKRQDGLDLTSVQLLGHVYRSPGCRQSDISDALGIDHAAISRALKLLIVEGLIVRTADQLDGRASTLSLTPRGEQRFVQVRSERVDFFAQALSQWDAADVANLHRLLQQLNLDLEETLEIVSEQTMTKQRDLA